MLIAPVMTSCTRVSYNPQDATVMPTDQIVLHGVAPDWGGVATDKVKLNDNLAPVEGHYVFPEPGREQLAAHTFASVARTVDLFREHWPGDIQWATQLRRLHVYSDQGEMLNAYYSRDDGGLYFFHHTDPVTQERVHTAASGEVSSHEAGHALLDAVRPGYFGTWTSEPMAFHESFGDVLALLVSLQDDRVLDQVAAQTGGDLTVPNVVSALGEQLGITINHTVGYNETGGDYTRSALNSFTYADPATLPWNAPHDQLGGEPHSFARVWTGAFYDVLTAIAKDSSCEPKEALRQAAREGLKMYARLLQKAPEGDFTFPQMAQALVDSENQLNMGRYTDLITRVFTERKLLVPGTERPGPAEKRTLTLDGPEFGRFQGATVEQLGGSDARMKAGLARLIAAGDIKYTEPNQPVRRQDLFKPDGSPYAGVARWTDGQLTLERISITDCWRKS